MKNDEYIDPFPANAELVERAAAVRGETVFGRLQDLVPREAWPHEAHAFTPWLAKNIDQLSEVIGIPLELTGQEVRVEMFAADILAQNSNDDSVVLIENQLEMTDHTHLGQILTYLAGLGAKTVVWIAPNFREPHLSAIRWLNEHTADGFSFFAVKLRVVRIGDSPFAPIFEVLERPNGWDRQLQAAIGERESLMPIRGDYWREFDRLVPDNGTQAEGRHRYINVDDDGEVHIKLSIKRDRAQIWVASRSLQHPEDFRAWFGEQLPALESRLGPFGNNKKMMAFRHSTGCDLMDRESWNATLQWHADELRRYRKALEDVLGGMADGQ